MCGLRVASLALCRVRWRGGGSGSRRCSLGAKFGCLGAASGSFVVLVLGVVDGGEGGEDGGQVGGDVETLVHVQSALKEGLCCGAVLEGEMQRGERIQGCGDVDVVVGAVYALTHGQGLFE